MKLKFIILIIFTIVLTINLYCNECLNKHCIYNSPYLHTIMYSYNNIDYTKSTYVQLPKIGSDIKQTTIRRARGCFKIALDTVVLPGIQLGYGWIIYDSTSTSEEFINIHSNTLGSFATTIGVFFTKNTFKTEDRVGLYGIWNVGIDYAIVGDLIGEPGGISGTNDRNGRLIFPYFTFGAGYSMKIGNGSFFRISGDIGLKILIANITFSFIFLIGNKHNDKFVLCCKFFLC